jgi:hypothetical protein
VPCENTRAAYSRYFGSDFPYEGDQWISAAPTNWAKIALIPVTPKAAH